MRKDLLDWADTLDRWETARCNIRQRCEEAAATMGQIIDTSMDELPLQDLFLEDSPERNAIETRLKEEITRLELDLRAIIADATPSAQNGPYPIVAVNTGLTSVATEPISDFTGWSYVDIGGFLVGGSTASGIALAGSRAAPMALGAVGIGVAAAPIAIAAGIAGLAFSAYGLTTRKRSNYQSALKDGVARLVLSEGTPPSILSSHLELIDNLYNPLLEA